MATRKKKGKSISGHNLIFIMLCIALLTIGIVLLFFSLFAIYKSYDIKMELDIGDFSSFNTDTDYIKFGSAKPGNSNTRTIVLSHSYKRPLLVHFKTSGNISRFVSVPDDFYLEPGLSKEVAISAIPPEGAAFGKYEGSLTVYFRRI